MSADFRKDGAPDELMGDVRWNFNEDRFVDEVAFVVALREYNELIKGKFTFDPDAPVLDSPSVMIQYEYWVGDEDDSVEDTVDLEADNGRSFRQVELLFKVHNAICTRVAEGDHTFFEGFSRSSWESSRRPGVPLYFVTLGS